MASQAVEVHRQRTSSRRGVLVYNAGWTVIRRTVNAKKYIIPYEGVVTDILTGQHYESDGTLEVQDHYAPSRASLEAWKKAGRPPARMPPPTELILTAEQIVRQLTAADKGAKNGLCELNGLTDEENEQIKAAARRKAMVSRKADCEAIIARYNARIVPFVSNPANAGKPRPEMTPEESAADLFLARLEKGRFATAKRTLCRFGCGFSTLSEKDLNEHIDLKHFEEVQAEQTLTEVAKVELAKGEEPEPKKRRRDAA